jgi:hypothetical protein
VFELAEAVLEATACAARGILFDKITAGRRIRARGGRKTGIVPVQPPAHVLERMVSIRSPFDLCDKSKGAFYLIPSSHRWGQIIENRVRMWARPHSTEAGDGDAFGFRGLIVQLA